MQIKKINLVNFKNIKLKSFLTKNVKIIICSLLNNDQYICKKVLLSNFRASSYFNLFNSKLSKLSLLGILSLSLNPIILLFPFLLFSKSISGIFSKGFILFIINCFSLILSRYITTFLFLFLLFFILIEELAKLDFFGGEFTLSLILSIRFKVLFETFCDFIKFF